MQAGPARQTELYRIDGFRIARDKFLLIRHGATEFDSPALFHDPDGVALGWHHRPHLPPQPVHPIGGPFRARTDLR